MRGLGTQRVHWPEALLDGLALRPDGPHAARAAYMAWSIYEARLEPDLAAENILVACVGRKAIVRGTVGTRLRKVKAGLLVLRQGQVARVANRLVVISD